MAARLISTPAPGAGPQAPDGASCFAIDPSRARSYPSGLPRALAGLHQELALGVVRPPQPEARRPALALLAAEGGPEDLARDPAVRVRRDRLEAVDPGSEELDGARPAVDQHDLQDAERVEAVRLEDAALQPRSGRAPVAVLADQRLELVSSGMAGPLDQAARRASGRSFAIRGWRVDYTPADGSGLQPWSRLYAVGALGVWDGQEVWVEPGASGRLRVLPPSGAPRAVPAADVTLGRAAPPGPRLGVAS